MVLSANEKRMKINDYLFPFDVNDIKTFLTAKKYTINVWFF